MQAESTYALPHTLKAAAHIVGNLFEAGLYQIGRRSMADSNTECPLTAFFCIGFTVCCIPEKMVGSFNNAEATPLSVFIETNVQASYIDY